MINCIVEDSCSIPQQNRTSESEDDMKLASSFVKVSLSGMSK